MNAPETFCGSVCASNPQKVSEAFKESATASSAREAAQATLAKGRDPKERVKSLGLARLEDLRASLPGSEQQGSGASDFSLARVGDEHACPFRSQMAEAELEGVFSELRLYGVPRNRLENTQR
jgi:hypothetical protein